MNPPKQEQPIGFPENIYVTVPARDFNRARVGIFPFECPEPQLEASYVHPPDAGYGAALALYHKLLETHILPRISLEPVSNTHDRARLLKTARERGLDLIITGRVLYLFEGSSQLPALLNEEIHIMEVATGQMLFYAETSEAVPPFIQSDLIFVLIQGRNAPPIMTLMEKNALKFCQLLSTLRE